MSKSLLRLEAISLRNKGESIRNIANNLRISRSTASLWLRGISLSSQQLSELKSHQAKCHWEGVLKAALIKKQDKAARFRLAEQDALKQIGTLSDRELMIAGLCLYWAEGSKKSNAVRFCNSDPKMIKFYLCWLERVFQVSPQSLSCYVGINAAHRDREALVKTYWSNITGISMSNFTKTSFKKYPLRKVYENFTNHYGTLTIRVRRPGKIYAQILGEIHALMPG